MSIFLLQGELTDHQCPPNYVTCEGISKCYSQRILGSGCLKGAVDYCRNGRGNTDLVLPENRKENLCLLSHFGNQTFILRAWENDSISHFETSDYFSKNTFRPVKYNNFSVGNAESGKNINSNFVALFNRGFWEKRVTQNFADNFDFLCEISA